MLNPNNDRVDYGEILAPPADSFLDFAVGTTYSLDLDALVGASLALGLSAETDSELMQNPVFLLEALRSVGGKVALFCEGGQIHTPNRANELYILLEKMVFSVNIRKKSSTGYPSFHPKFWLIRYVNKSLEFIYRVVVLSRNMTFDHSWDVCYFMDGEQNKRLNKRNEPIVDFLSYLSSQLHSNKIEKNKKEEIKQLIEDIPYVWFRPSEKAIKDYEFIPGGIKRSNGDYYRFYENNLFKNTFDETLIISPFLSNNIIQNFNNRNNNRKKLDLKCMLFTREISLGKLKQEDVSNFEIYTMRDNVIDGEEAISEDNDSIQKQDIHAKIYFLRKGSKSELYLGSLNASHNAFYENIEFMLCLKSNRRYLDIDKLSKSLFCGDVDGRNNPFQRVTLEDTIIEDDDNRTDDLDAIIKTIDRSKPKAFVTEDDSEKYSVEIIFDDCDTKNYKVEVKPLLSNKIEQFRKNVIFEDLSITQLSEFYKISVEDKDKERTVARILIIPTKGLPEEREKAVVSHVVSNRDNFYSYIEFLLGEDKILEAKYIKSNNEGIQSRKSYKTHALYEKMLKAAANDPSKFESIEYLIKTISEDGIIPEEFKNLYETFKKAVK